MPSLTLLLAWLIGLGIPPGPGVRSSLWSLPTCAGVLIGLLVGLNLLAAGFSRLVFERSRRYGWLDDRTRATYVRGTRVLEFIGLGAYAWFLHSLGYLHLLNEWTLPVPVIRELLLLAPYALIQAATWIGTWPADRSLLVVSGGMSRNSWITRRLRLGWGLLLPVGMLLISGQWLLDLVLPRWSREPGTQLAAAVAFSTIMLVLAPVLIRIAMPTHSLEAGPVRSHLLELARRLNFRVRDIRVWDTGHTAANAAITGVLPCLREVLISDVLIEHIDEQGLESVFTHEVGHAKHHHLVDMAIFLAGSIALVILSSRGLAWLLPDLVESPWAWLLDLVILLLFGIHVVVFLGILSRRFERQADLFGCRAYGLLKNTGVSAGTSQLTLPAISRAELSESAVDLFASTLLSVSAINGIDPEVGTWRGRSLAEKLRSAGELVRTWRHGSVMSRVKFLLLQLEDPRATANFERRLLSLRIGLILLSVIACSLVLWLATLPAI